VQHERGASGAHRGAPGAQQTHEAPNRCIMCLKWHGRVVRRTLLYPRLLAQSTKFITTVDCPTLTTTLFTSKTMAAESAITAASKTGTNDDNVIFGEDQNEAERLDMQHQVIFDSMPELVTAPIDLSKGGLKILDQATGSGEPSLSPSPSS
jgi:hypothetical protein